MKTKDNPYESDFTPTPLTAAAEWTAIEEYEKYRECGYPPFRDYGILDLCRKLEVELNRHKELVEVIKKSRLRRFINDSVPCHWLFELPMTDEEMKIFTSFFM